MVVWGRASRLGSGLLSPENERPAYILTSEINRPSETRSRRRGWSPWKRAGCRQGLRVHAQQPFLSLSSHLSVLTSLSPEGMDSRGKEGVPRVKATDIIVGGG